MSDYGKYKVKNLPNTAYYIPNFINSSEENFLLEKVYSAPKPKWKTLSNRRLQNWGGLPHPKGMIQEELPKWLCNIIDKISELNIFGEKVPNHVLVNEYLPGQGIMPHEDGPLFYPTIATVNIGSHTVLDYYEKITAEECSEAKSETPFNKKYIGSLLLERCSLLLVQDNLYQEYLHGIQERTVDCISESVKNLDSVSADEGQELNRDLRISLTIRHVPHTVKTKFLFGIK